MLILAYSRQNIAIKFTITGLTTLNMISFGISYKTFLIYMV